MSQVCLTSRSAFTHTLWRANAGEAREFVQRGTLMIRTAMVPDKSAGNRNTTVLS